MCADHTDAISNIQKSPKSTLSIARLKELATVISIEINSNSKLLKSAVERSKCSITNDEINISVAPRHAQRNESLHKTLKSIFDQTYTNKCTKCNQFIPVERLIAKPITTLCVKCKSLKEIENTPDQQQRHLATA
jgi:RNA polymerase-binding transcription factor DksA